MEVSSYFPSSSLKIANPINYKLSKKSSNLTTKRSTISPSLGFNRRSNFKDIPTKHNYYKLNFIRACSIAESDPIRERVGNFGDVCWRLIKPYTAMGVITMFCSSFARVLIGSPNLIEWSLVIKAVLLGIFTVVCENTYISITNQIYDVEIDKINKPHYPIAAGDLPVTYAWAMAVFFAAAGLSIVGFTCGTFSMFIYGIALFLGSAYSIPPLRLKESAFGTIICISLLMGFVPNFGVNYAMTTFLGLPFQWSAPLVFMIIFITVITGVMAFMKDLPDVDGDSKFGIKTLPSILGMRNTAYLGFGVLLLNYVGAIVAAIYMPQALNPSLTIPAHLILASFLIYQMRLLEQSNYTKEASERFYRVIWNLYSAEYLIFPFI